MDGRARASDRAFDAGYVAVRLFGAPLPDRFGGARIAKVSLIVQALGRAVLWLASVWGIVTLTVDGRVWAGTGIRPPR
jgi:hypothetical protein